MFFSEISQFPEVKDGRIDISLFLEASRGIVRFIELLGSLFIPVRNDIMGNIEKLQKIHCSDKEKFSTVNDIIEYELKDGVEKVGIDALLWLKRALEYIHVFLTCLISDERSGADAENLVPHFSKAYEEKLKPYHGWFVQKIFGWMILAAPSKTSLLNLLVGETDTATEEEMFKDIQNYLLNLSNNLKVINNIYQAHNLDSDVKV